MGSFSRKNTKRIILNTNIDDIDEESEIEMLNGEIKNLRNQISLLTRECVNGEKDIFMLHVVLFISGIVHLFVAWYIIQF
jgi:hypothetical protein